MNPADRPSPSPEVVLREGFADYVLLFHPLFADVVGLTPVALATWRALDGRRTVAQVAAQVQAQFDGAPESVVDDVAAFLSDLARRGFVQTEATQPSPTPWLPPSPKVEEGRRLGKGEGFLLSLADGSRFVLRAGDESGERGERESSAGRDRGPAPARRREWGVHLRPATPRRAAAAGARARQRPPIPGQRQIPAGWSISPQNQGSDEAVDSDADPAKGFSFLFDFPRP